MIGELQRGAQYLYEAIELSVKEVDYSVATVAYFRLGNVLKVQGRLVEAEKIYLQNLLALKEMGGQNSPMLGKSEIGLGDVLRERGQLNTARELLSMGHKHSKLQGQPYDLVYSYIYLARLLQAEGKEQEALEMLSEAEPLFYAYTNPPAVRLAFESYQVSLWVRLGKMSQAEPEGYMRIFLDEDKPMLQLLKHLRRSCVNSTIKHYIDRLLNSCTHSPN